MRVKLRLWDVDWNEGGVGKHGRGPFATERQARACLNAVGWEGQVEQSIWQMEKVDAERIAEKGRVELASLMEH